MSVLNFMYMGEVNVAQEELNSFLSVAEDLRVKGLTQNNSEASTKVIPKQDPPKQSIRARDPPERDPVPPPKRTRPIISTPQISAPAPIQRQSHQPVEDDDIQEVVPVKSEPRDPPPQPIAPVERQQVVYQEQQSMDMMEEQDQGTVALDDSTGMMDPNTGMAMGGDGNKAVHTVVASKMYERVDLLGKRLWQCAECDYARNKKDHVTKHVEQKHSGLQFQCEICQAIFHRRDTYRDHMKKKHTYTS